MPPDAMNGLQVANSGAVTRIGAAVDLCEATVRMAAEEHADLLLVHHGLFWGGLRPVVGPAYRRVAGLINENVALYAAPSCRSTVILKSAITGLARLPWRIGPW